MRAGALIELVDRAEALRMDEGLVRMARSETAVRLAMGDAFVALENGWQELGFSSFEACVRERCVRSARWARDTRSLARRLAVLPHIRARLMRGRIGWSMAELLARYATADDEEELLEATKGMTVRQVRRAMRERGEVAEPVEERIGTLELSCTFEEACALVATQPMAELVAGKGVGAWMEGLLGEAQDWLTIIAPHADPMPEDVIARQKAWLDSIARGEELADRREARAEAALPTMPEIPLSPLDELPSGPNAIDRVLFRELAPRLAGSDVRFGEQLAKFFAVRGWRVLGFASEKQYADERLGMSRSSVRTRIALWRRVVHLQRLGDALRDGAVGYEAATLIARVATPDTEEAWIERARRRTFKHLAEEIHAVEMIRQMMRLEDPPGPPDEAEVAIAQSIERDFVSGAYARRAFAMERGEEDDAPSVDEGSSSPYAEMARAARTVQEQLRTVIEAARARSGAMTEGRRARGVRGHGGTGRCAADARPRGRRRVDEGRALPFGLPSRSREGLGRAGDVDVLPVAPTPTLPASGGGDARSDSPSRSREDEPSRSDSPPARGEGLGRAGELSCPAHPQPSPRAREGDARSDSPSRSREDEPSRSTPPPARGRGLGRVGEVDVLPVAPPPQPSPRAGRGTLAAARCPAVAAASGGARPARRASTSLAGRPATTQATPLARCRRCGERRALHPLACADLDGLRAR
ncbi:MAG: hypothetical protein M5U28_05680 [Sandaracinaceae bacterium]|nr:hypothetical protein [Sandaracinaceae bacterium]